MGKATFTWTEQYVHTYNIQSWELREHICAYIKIMAILFAYLRHHTPSCESLCLWIYIHMFIPIKTCNRNSFSLCETPILLVRHADSYFVTCNISVRGTQFITVINYKDTKKYYVVVRTTLWNFNSKGHLILPFVFIIVRNSWFPAKYND